ncbi:Zn(II)2Cys6 transcription factor [Kocuria palustris]|nr:Zn(II)2Cys6 transcription factor [Kocuria palustris]
MEDDQDGKKRIRVACETCRRKKIKCNGQQPCSNCVHVRNSKCVYKERIIKKRLAEESASRKRRHLQLMELFDMRLSKMERILWSISNRMESLVGPCNNLIKPVPSHDSYNMVPLPGHLPSSSEVDEGVDEEEDDDGPLLDEKVGVNEGKSLVVSTVPTEPPIEVYIGNHLIMCIFSRKSLDWILTALGLEGIVLTNPIRNLPVIFFSKLKLFIRKWVDPPVLDLKGRRRLLERPFSLSREGCFALLEAASLEIAITGLIIDTCRVEKLFQKYYDALESGNRVQIKCSELLIMCLILLWCITFLVDEIARGAQLPPVIANELDSEDLQKLKDQLFNQAIAYYHRICVISEGLPTIQGILLFMMYIEANWFILPINYILGTVALRFAQEIGLHRLETYECLSYEESLERRRVWWFCYYFDVEICFRTGKPPLIDLSDVTTDSYSDFTHFFTWAACMGQDLSEDVVKAHNELLQELLRDPSKPERQLIKFSNLCGEPIAGQVYLKVLSEIRAKLYNRIFSARAKQYLFPKFMDVLEELNEEMAAYAECISSERRPRFWDDPHFDTNKLEFVTAMRDRRESFNMHLAYFLHLMIINRVPLVVDTANLGNEEILKINRSRHLCFQLARTILHLCKDLNRLNCSMSYFNWIAFFPSSAFLCLVAGVINHPHSDSLNDINLLIHLLRNFFAIADLEEGDAKARFYHKEAMVGLIIKLMLKITTVIYETRNNLTVFLDDAGLQHHFDSARLMFPELFMNHKELRAKIKGVTGDLPFGNNKNPLLSSTPQSRVLAMGDPQTGPGGAGTQYHALPTEYMPVGSKMPPCSDGLMGGMMQASYDPNTGMMDNLNVPVNVNKYAALSNLDSANLTPQYLGILHGNFFDDAISNDSFGLGLYLQTESMPNFFFDNNVGLE